MDCAWLRVLRVLALELLRTIRKGGLMQPSRYCPHNWTILLKAVAQDALQRSGLPDARYCQLLGEQVDCILEFFSPEDRDQAVRIALQYGYAQAHIRPNSSRPLGES